MPTAAALTTIMVYCAVILLASLAGGVIPRVVRLNHQRMELALSFVAGFMLGVALLHLLPHALDSGAGQHVDGATHDDASGVLSWFLCGLLVMFLVGRFFGFHHHGDDTDDRHAARAVSSTGATLGFTIHTLVGGIALAASVVTAMRLDQASLLPGFGMFLIIALHKPFDAMAIATLLTADGVTPRRRHVVNVLFALLTAAGALIFIAVSAFVGGPGNGVAGDIGSTVVISAALAFSAGTFVCIALSDLLPELRFHEHDRWKLSAALILGASLAAAIAQLEAVGH